MVAFTSLFALALLSADVLAIRILYAIDYKDPSKRTRNENGPDVTAAQATKIKENMYVWSQGHYTATEAHDLLVIKNSAELDGYDATNNMLRQMKATVAYHVTGF